MVRHALAEITGYPFVNADLLRQSLTHRSFGAPHNERLEFLGDGVLNCIIAALLFERFPQLAEGDLSRLRASLVNQQSLYEIAQQIELGGELLLGEGELKSGGAQRPSILADAIEALIGATFLDGGFDAARAVVVRLFERQLAGADPQTVGKDAKTLLQELLQSRRIALPQYSVVATAGEAHEQNFRVECAIPELKIRTQGEGSSRRAAEQIAAGRAHNLATAGK
ncbi:MAG: rnc [Betaproteobacteria bacterium]|nr:rnc [Betaproteobacteria bacterium]